MESTSKGEKIEQYPRYDVIHGASHCVEDLIRLAEGVEAYVDSKSSYVPEWRERLRLAHATLKDQIGSNLPANVAAAALTTVLLDPSKERAPTLSKAEIQEFTEPTEEEFEAWAWGEDSGRTGRWFFAAITFAILGSLALAALSYGFESPRFLDTTIFAGLSIGAFGFSAASLGYGLYRNYVTYASLSWEDRVYPEAEVKRRFGRRRKLWPGWFVYAGGGILLSASIVGGRIVAIGKDSPILDSYTVVRFGVLGALAVGTPLFLCGVWPVIRRVIEQSEVDSRLGRARSLRVPRIITAMLPVLTTLGTFFLNWLLFQGS